MDTSQSRQLRDRIDTLNSCYRSFYAIVNELREQQSQVLELLHSQGIPTRGYEPCIFRSENSRWRLRFTPRQGDVEEGTLSKYPRPYKGLDVIAQLLKNPNKRYLASDLASEIKMVHREKAIATVEDVGEGESDGWRMALHRNDNAVREAGRNRVKSQLRRAYKAIAEAGLPLFARHLEDALIWHNRGWLCYEPFGEIRVAV